MKNKSTLYATDRDIYEALVSKQKKFNIELLIELIRDRGILVSNELTREQLIDYLSFLPHDYNDFNYLADLLIVNSRQEKLSSTSINNNISRDEITEVIKSISDERSQLGENYEITAESEVKTVIKIDYTEMDLSKTRLRQKQEKTAYIEIIKEEDGNTKIRKPANDKMTGIVNEIVKRVEIIKDEKIENINISLKGIEDSKKRTKFFTDMIRQIPDVRLSDVTIVKVDRVETPDTIEDDTDDEDSEEIAQRFLGQVKTIAMNGEGLLYSEEYQHLLSQGFYIYSIVWQAEEEKDEGDRIEFEASFGNSSDCTDFRYAVKGIYHWKNEDSFNVSKLPPNEITNQKYLALIEASAKKSMIEIMNG